MVFEYLFTTTTNLYIIQFIYILKIHTKIQKYIYKKKLLKESEVGHNVVGYRK